MQMRCKDGSVMVCGNCSKDGELKYVGEKNTPKCSVGLAVGKRQPEDGGDPETVWCNVVAWRGVAEVLSTAKKGDPVFAVGRLKSREYEGKTYTDLVADFVSICTPKSAHGTPEYGPAPESGFRDIDENDGDLPF